MVIDQANGKDIWEEDKTKWESRFGAQELR